MLPLLHDILIRFRIGQIGIVVDVQHAFCKLKSMKTIGIFYDLFCLTMFYLIIHHMFYYVLQEFFTV